MAETSGFFNAQLVDDKPDRVYEASDFAAYYASLISNGVFANPANQLQVTADQDGKSVTIHAGKAFVNGYWYNLSEDIQMSLPSSTAPSMFYDAIVIELNLASRQVICKYLSEISTSTPTVENLTRNSNVYQLCLAYIRRTSSTIISQNSITDTRPYNDFCGWVTGIIDQINTTGLFIQYDEAFSEWFDGVKDLLDDTDVYEIKSEINDIMQLLGSGITTLRELNNGTGIRLWVGTKATYEAIKAQGQLLSNVLYIRYDDTTVDDIQDAIEELTTQVSQINQKLEHTPEIIFSTSGSGASINCPAQSDFTTGALNTPFENNTECRKWTPIIHAYLAAGSSTTTGIYWSWYVFNNKLYIQGHNGSSSTVMLAFSHIMWIKNRED